MTVTGLDIGNAFFSGDWSGTIQPAGSAHASITFTPLMVDSEAATRVSAPLRIFSNNSAGTVRTNVTGKLATARIAITGESLFATPIGQSDSHVLTITNDGEIEYRVTSITCPPGFSVDWDSGIIHFNDSVELTVTFTPTEESHYADGILQLESNSITFSSSEFPLMAVETRMHISGDEDFGAVELGAEVKKTVTLENLSDRLITVSQIEFPEGFSGEWNFTEIAPLSSAIIELTFMVEEDRVYFGDMVVHSDANATGEDFHTVYGSGPGSGAFRFTGDARYVAESYYESAWLGGFFADGNYADTHFVFSFNLGWLWLFSSPSNDPDDGLWMWSNNLATWLWGSVNTDRFFYSQVDGAWLYVLGVENGSWIWNAETNEWSFNPRVS